MVAGFPPPRNVGSPTSPAQMHFPATMRNPVDVPDGQLAGEHGPPAVVTGYGLRLGRTPDNDLVIDDGEVSRHHCAITAIEGGFVLTDLHSTNGTYLGDRRITSQVLADGDRLRVGSCVLTFRWPVG